MRLARAVSTSADSRIVRMTSSRWSRAILRPSRTWARSRALPRSNSVRRRTISRRCSTWCASTDFSGQRLGLAVDERQHVEVERQLHRGVLEQVVQHRVRVGVVLDLDVDPHAVPVGLVAQVGDPVDPLVLHQVGDLLEKGRLVHLVRQLGDDDRHPVAAGLLEGDLGPHDHAAVAVGVHLADRVDGLGRAGDGVLLRLVAEDRAAGREVGAPDEGAQVVGGQLRDRRSGRSRRPRSRRGGAAGCWSPSRPRSPTSR